MSSYVDVEHVPGTCTDEEGHFVPTPPVPLLGGRYRFVKKIGRGSFALLIRAEDTFDPARQHVAIKVMHAQYAAIGEQEGSMLLALNAADPLGVSGVVRCLQTFTWEAHYCICFELLASTPLRHCVEVACQVTTSRKLDHGVLRMGAIRKIAAQLLASLVFLRQNNVIHADLKPENVLLRDADANNCAVKLADFGNAFEATADNLTQYYRDYELQSLWYRAPEVLLGVPFSGCSIDTWSLGCILAELYLGRPIFGGNGR
eukprot:UC1_evm1s136